MKAMLVDNAKNLIWSEVPDPTPKGNEVIIKIHATALNRADLLQRAGTYPSPVGWPECMGLECAGVIEYAPQNNLWQVGDKVCALLGGGGYAEKVAVPEALVMPIPKGLSMIEAASLPEVFATSYLNICIEGNMQPTDTVFVQAGASGIGIATIQLAKAFGAKVITTVSNEEKRQIALKLGADIVVNRKSEDLGEILAANPVDIALDCVGGENLGHHIEKLAHGGRWILISTLGGISTELALRVILKNNLRLIGSTLRSRTNEMKGFILSELVTKVWPLLENGTIKPVIDSVYKVEDASIPHTILENNKNLGKVVLTII